MSCRVELADHPNGPWAKVFIGPALHFRFSVEPIESASVGWVAKIREWETGKDPFYVRRRIWVDQQGRPTRFSDAEPGESFAWLLDLAMEAGLTFPALDEETA